MNPPISVVINTLDAEPTLALALRSVRSWVDEIVVVDMHSTDRTVEIAESYGAQVHLHEPLGYVEPAREFAVDRARNDWILLLDADEVIPFPLSRRLLQTASEGSADVLLLPTVNYILGHPPLGHTGWGPMQDLHARFFRKGCLEFGDVIHSLHRPRPGAVVETVEFAPGMGIVHFNYLGTSDFIERLNRYTTVEARHGNRKQVGSLRATYDALRSFVRRFFFKRGYRDGWRGFYLSAFMGFYEIAAHAKRVEAGKVGSEDDIRQAYVNEAEKLLSSYAADR